MKNITIFILAFGLHLGDLPTASAGMPTAGDKYEIDREKEERLRKRDAARLAEGRRRRREAERARRAAEQRRKEQERAEQLRQQRLRDEAERQERRRYERARLRREKEEKRRAERNRRYRQQLEYDRRRRLDEQRKAERRRREQDELTARQEREARRRHRERMEEIEREAEEERRRYERAEQIRAEREAEEERQRIAAEKHERFRNKIIGTGIPAKVTGAAVRASVKERNGKANLEIKNDSDNDLICTGTVFATNHDGKKISKAFSRKIYAGRTNHISLNHKINNLKIRAVKSSVSCEAAPRAEKHYRQRDKPEPREKTEKEVKREESGWSKWFRDYFSENKNGKDERKQRKSVEDKLKEEQKKSKKRKIKSSPLRPFKRHHSRSHGFDLFATHTVQGAADHAYLYIKNDKNFTIVCTGHLWGDNLNRRTRTKSEYRKVLQPGSFMYTSILPEDLDSFVDVDYAGYCNKQI